MIYLTVWCILGCVCFFIARASWNWSFGCAPITVGTILKMLFFMWLPPFSLLAAICWAIMKLIDDDVFSWMDYELANPCKWFRKTK